MSFAPGIPQFCFLVSDWNATEHFLSPQLIMSSIITLAYWLVIYHILWNDHSNILFIFIELFLYWIEIIICVFWYFLWYMNYKYSHPAYVLPFHFLNGLLWRANFKHFVEISFINPSVVTKFKSQEPSLITKLQFSPMFSSRKRVFLYFIFDFLFFIFAFHTYFFNFLNI